MAVIAMMMTISASAQFYIYCSDGNVIKVDSISMIAPADAEDPTNPNNPSTPSQGIGVFSVSATKQVTFSPGNLQYTQSTNTWSFAENQWDYIGTDNVTGGSVSSDPTASDSQEGTALADKVDLFCWSTSTTNFGVSTSTNDNDYSGSFVDWDTNKIGNDNPNTWRTLTYDEWYYLRYTRTNADDLYGVAQVNGVNGLIFLPDNWTCPEGVTFKSGFHSDYSVEAYSQYQTFTAEQWSTLEKSGAIFLPAAGRRCGTNVNAVQYYGSYWSATEYDSSYAYYLNFAPTGATMGHFIRYYGRCVRLVKDVEGENIDPEQPGEGGEEPETPTNIENGHEYVDLGLSVKWATCNVGATKPEEYGDYFAWGEVTPANYYVRAWYQWAIGDHDYKKYCTDSFYGTIDNKTVLELSDDAARANWGGKWRVPTDSEWTELRGQCIWTWTTQNGVNGYKVTSKNNSNSIFIPAAGTRADYEYEDAWGTIGWEVNLSGVGHTGCYWSSSLHTYNSSSVWCVSFNSTSVSRTEGYRVEGCSVRPVCQ